MRRRSTLFFWWALIISIPLSFRYLVGQFISGFQEYEAAFIYGSDFLILGLIVLGFPLLLRAILLLSRPLRWSLGAFLALAWASFLLAPIPLLSLYNGLRLTILLAAALIGVELLQSERIRQGSIRLVAILGMLEGLWALVQFKLQHAIGAWYLGESPLSVLDPATAKVVLEGGRLMRSAGSFLHANVLGAFLTVSLFCLLSWLVQTDKKLYQNAYDRTFSVGINARRFFCRPALYQKWALAIGGFVIALGLALTFSRSSWIAAAFGLIIFFVFHRPFKSTVRVAPLVIVLALALWLSLGWAIVPRASFSAAEPSVSHRVIYNQIGSTMLLEHPLGVGLGNQVVSAVTSNEFIPRGLTLSWQWQPIHNLYLLIGVEIGVIGLLSFLIFLGMVCVRAILRRDALIIALLAATTVLALFDHYFWTLEQGRLMLWLVIALALSVAAKKPKLSSFNG